jgi:hypothetical protein
MEFMSFREMDIDTEWRLGIWTERIGIKGGSRPNPTQVAHFTKLNGNWIVLDDIINYAQQSVYAIVGVQCKFVL